MSLLKFLLYRNKEKSILASKKYGEKQVNPEKLDKPLLATKVYTKLDKENATKKELSIQ